MRSKLMKAIPESADPQYSRCVLAGCAGCRHQFLHDPDGRHPYVPLSAKRLTTIPHVNSDVIAAAHISANRRNPAPNSVGRPKEQAATVEIPVPQDTEGAQIG